MPGSLQVAVIAGIPIRLHWSFAVALMYFTIEGKAQAGATLLCVLILFGCVLLHELGHALMARQFGLPTRSITLSFLGGATMLKGRPKPWQDFWIALAGPVVNLVIFMVLGIYMAVSPVGYDLSKFSPENVVVLVLWGNLFLFLFNLLPAFPMDGGRMLRALLSVATDEVKGTRISVGIGQVLAIFLFLAGLITSDFILTLIAFFIFMGASVELAGTLTRALLEGRAVKEAMMTSLFSLRTGDTIGTAATTLMASSQTEFPVIAGDEVVGIIGANEIARGMQIGSGQGYVSEFMRPDVRRVAANQLLVDCADLLAEDKTPIIVEEENRMIGVIDSTKIRDFILLTDRSSKSNRRYPS